MPVKAVLKIDGKKFNLLEAAYHFSRFTDLSGYGSSQIRFERIALLLPSNGDIFFLNWMFEPAMQKSGSISFYQDEEMIRKVKQVAFAGAFCVGFKEVYHDVSPMPMHTELTISAGGIKIEESIFRFPWFRGPFKAEVDEGIENKVVEHAGSPSEDVPLNTGSPIKNKDTKSFVENLNIVSEEKKRDYQPFQEIAIEEKNIGYTGLDNRDGEVRWHLMDTVSKGRFALIHAPEDGSGGPQMTLNPKQAIILNQDLVTQHEEGGIYVCLKAQDFKWTPLGIATMIQLYKDKFVYPPDNLPGILAWDNLRNFQTEYVQFKKTNKKLSDNEAAALAIKNISFGKHRMDAGYGIIEVTLGRKVLVDINGKQEQVPTIININAFKN